MMMMIMITGALCEMDIFSSQVSFSSRKLWFFYTLGANENANGCEREVKAIECTLLMLYLPLYRITSRASAWKK